ncbi:flagellar basal body-associated FliL family protein [Aureimonas sp. AU40]|uniref:flagellar basal body-associated FliL family protein n=1 Tax=Aureimonas sp. AU40 TaxID=1637747 RepID=UPI00078237F9|nr:flagellar basal body-associated FliL family protein [Aureimonas sp. AU40]
MTDLTPEALAILAGGDPQAKKGGRMQTIAVVAGLTLLAGGGGAALGFLLKPAPAPAPATETAASDPAAAAAHGEAKPGEHSAKAETGEGGSLANKEAKGQPPRETFVAIPAILTDLASPVGAQVRLEMGLVLRSEEKVDETVLSSQIQADTLVFLRTLELAQIEGSRGLLHLKEDLLERARLRSPAVVDVTVRSLVVK